MKNSDISSEIINVLENNAGIIHKMSLLYSNNKEEMKDLKQEISYQIVKSFNRFQGESKVSTWVYKVALFTALTQLKSKKKINIISYDIPEAEDISEENDRWSEVLIAIKSLKPVDKSLVFLYLENKSYAEMAEIMGLSESNIGVRLNRVKKQLKELLT